MLNIQNVTKIINGQTILDSISCTLKYGEIVALLGPSGSGKSTLLQCLSRLTPTSKGSISLNNNDINTLAASRIGVVFQSFNLFPHLTVLENLTYAPKKLALLPKKEAEEKALELLEKFGLKDKSQLHPHHLSGGQKQRVAIARAIIMDPDILLFDEPTSALDPEMVTDVADLIFKSKRKNRLIILATHELKICKLIADHILFLDQGKLVENTSKQEFFSNPTCEIAKVFIQKMQV